MKLGEDHFTTVGLPDTAVRESRERIRAALKNCGYDIPPTHITINLAPADLKKEGSGFDLPMALGILGAYGGLAKQELGEFVIVGELEICGTSFGNWYWMPVAPWTHIPSGNPPSVIAAGYGVIDGSVLVVMWLFYRCGLNTIMTRITTTITPSPGPNLRLRSINPTNSGEAV